MTRTANDEQDFHFTRPPADPAWAEDADGDSLREVEPREWGPMAVVSLFGDPRRCRIVGRLASEDRGVSFHVLARGPLGALRAMLIQRGFSLSEGRITCEQAMALEIYQRGGRR